MEASVRTSFSRRAYHPDLAIDFDVHYFLRFFVGGPKVFGWVQAMRRNS